MGPGAWKADVEVEGVGFLAAKLFGVRVSELGDGSGVGSGWIGGGELRHHEVPGGGPGGADGGDEELWWEGFAP